MVVASSYFKGFSFFWLSRFWSIESLFIVGISAFLVSGLSFVMNIARGMGMAGLESGLSLLQKLTLVTIGGILLIVLGLDGRAYFIASIFGSLLAAMIGVYALYRRSVGLKIYKNGIVWPSILALMVVDLGTWVYFRIDILMIERMVGNIEAGLYGAAYTLFYACAVVASVMMAAIFPRLAGTKESDLRIFWIRKGAKLLALCAICIVVLIYPLSDMVSRVAFGENL